MKKIGMFMIVGALAWSLQACNNNRDGNDAMDTGDRMDYNDTNAIAPPMSDTSNMIPDTMGDGNSNPSDTARRNQINP